MKRGQGYPEYRVIHRLDRLPAVFTVVPIFQVPCLLVTGRGETG